MSSLAAVWLALACAPAPAPPEVVVDPLGVDVSSAEGVLRLTVSDPDGVPLRTRRAALPVPELAVPVRWEQPGPHTVDVWTPSGHHTRVVDVPAPPSVVVRVEAPAGQEPVAVANGDVVPLSALGGAPAQVAVAATAVRAGTATIDLGATHVERALTPGEPLVALAELSSRAVVDVSVDGEGLRFVVEPREVPLDVAQEALALVAVDFPADDRGVADLARAPWRVALPSEAWRQALRRLGLGFRGRDVFAPWAYVGVALRNDGPAPLHVVVQSAVVDARGEPAPAFAPRMRQGGDATGRVRVLLRLPPGEEVRTALPVFVDDAQLTQDAARSESWRQVVEVVPLGSSVALARRETPLYARRGGWLPVAGAAGAVASALGGFALVAARLRRWLSARTSDLMTIALFAGLMFVVSAFGTVAGSVVAAALGPLAPLLTGLFDDVARAALLATLVTLRPRPGTAALVALTTALLSGVAMGSFGLPAVIYTGGQVLWLEGMLWAWGPTRIDGFAARGRVGRGLRLAGALACAAVATTGLGLALHATLFRLYYADWYVALVLVGPGALYVGVGAWLAGGLADSLRSVAR